MRKCGCFLVVESIVKVDKIVFCIHVSEVTVLILADEVWTPRWCDTCVHCTHMSSENDQFTADEWECTHLYYEVEGSRFFQNIGIYLANYISSHPRPP